MLSFYDYMNTETNLANQRLMTDTIVPELAALIPGGGSAYSNEGDLNEPKWKEVFWGTNYQKLLGIKHKYDPESIFYARLTVGSDAWKEQPDGRLCRSKNSPV